MRFILSIRLLVACSIFGILTHIFAVLLINHALVTIKLSPLGERYT